MTQDYTAICQHFKVRSLCDLANELERLGFPQPEQFKIGQTWYNTGGSRVEIVEFRGGLGAEYYTQEGRKFQTKVIKGSPGAFATYLPTVKQIKNWVVLNS